MTNAQVVASPTLEQIEETVEKVEVIWLLVPRSARAMTIHKKVRDDIEKVLRLVHRFLATRSVQLQTAVAAAAASQAAGATTNGADAGAGATTGAEGDEEVAALPFIMRQLRLLSPEQVLQVRILLELRKLSDEGRLEVFQELEVSHHLDCGGELFADEEHVCDEGDDEGDDEDGDGEDDGEDARPDPAAPAESGTVLPVLHAPHAPLVLAPDHEHHERHEKET